MFEGENKIVLNEATVKKVVEHWLNTQVFDALAMVKVNTIADGDSQGWTVIFEPLPAPNEGAASAAATDGFGQQARPFVRPYEPAVG